MTGCRFDGHVVSAVLNCMLCYSAGPLTASLNIACGRHRGLLGCNDTNLQGCLVGILVCSLQGALLLQPFRKLQIVTVDSVGSSRKADRSTCTEA